MPQGYQIPPGLEDSPWEQYRAEQGITSINNDNRAGVYAGYELWKQNKQLQERYNQQTDPSSQLYQQHRAYLASATPSIGTNSLLAPLMAGGGNQAASSLQAGALRDEYRGERNDFLNQSTNQFALGMQGQGNSLLGQLSNNAQFSGNLAEQQRQFNISNTADFFDYLNLGTSFVSSLIPFSPSQNVASPGSGGGGGQMQPGGFQHSDIRLKENIQDTGEKTKDGIRIVEFNYIWGGERFRGVIANEAQKVRPDLVTTIDGYLAVNYGGL